MSAVLKLHKRKKIDTKDGDDDGEPPYFTAVEIVTVDNGWLLNWGDSEENEGSLVYTKDQAEEMLKHLKHAFSMGN